MLENHCLQACLMISQNSQHLNLYEEIMTEKICTRISIITSLLLTLILLFSLVKEKIIEMLEHIVPL